GAGQGEVAMDRDRQRMTFDIPGQVQVQTRAEKDNALVSREVMGPTYELLMSNQRQAGDPHQQLALRELDPYQHPQHLGGDVLDAGGPRVWPTSGRVSYGDERNRGEEFDQAVQEAAALGSLHRILGFQDRRFSGRRYRPTDNVEELLGPQSPYDTKGWQS